MKKRIVSLVLAMAMCFALSVTAFAADKESSSNMMVLEFEKLGYTCERVEYGTNIIVKTYDTEGRLVTTIELIDGNLYADGNLIFSGNIPAPSEVTFSMLPSTCVMANGTVTWGSWSTWSHLGDFSGNTIAVIVGGLAAIAPWVPVAALGTMASIYISQYDELSVYMRIRYGTDSTYQYYERETAFYGDGEHIDTYEDTGKSKLNGTVKAI